MQRLECYESRNVIVRLSLAVSDSSTTLSEVEFRLKDYGDYLKQLLDDGYECLSFADPRAREISGKHLLLRHDIDIDPEMAVPMARREAEVGARSTYYVLISTRHTNPLDIAFRHAVYEIANLGHWIGLHFDATQYGLTADSENFNECVQHEISLAEKILGVKMESISFHRPSRDLIASSAELTSPLRHTYEHVFMKEMEYCSDSSGKWAYGPPEDREAPKLGKPFHFLTHAIWWADNDLEPRERIESWMQHRHSFDLHWEMPDMWPAP